MRNFVVLAALVLMTHALVAEAKRDKSTIYSPVNPSATKFDQVIVRMDSGDDGEGFQNRMSNKMNKSKNNKKFEDKKRETMSTGNEALIAMAGLDEEDLQNILNDESVLDVEYVQVFTAVASTESRRQAPQWHLDRINQRTSDLDNNVDGTPEGTGQGVNIFVIDTGVDITHPVFGGRATNFFNVFEADGIGPDDGYGHGTHVAGLVGGSGHGAATGSTIHNVKVLDASGAGDTVTILAGLDHVLAHVTTDTSGLQNIVVMSLTGPPSNMIDAMIVRLYLMNVLVVVAAGNFNQDACSYTPARNPAAFTVGAMENGDAFASYSNWGGCVDIIAPGSRIESAIPGGQTAVYDGTSMAAPIVAGVAASLWSLQPEMTARQVSRTISMASTLDALTGQAFVMGTPNRLLFSAYKVESVSMSDFTSGALTMESIKGMAGYEEMAYAQSYEDWLAQRRRYGSSSYEASRRYYGSFFVRDTGGILSYAGVGAAEVTLDGRANVNGVAAENEVVGGDRSDLGSAGYTTIEGFLDSVGLPWASLYDFDPAEEDGVMPGLLGSIVYEASRNRYGG
eukprot:CFRG3738T1